MRIARLSVGIYVLLVACAETDTAADSDTSPDSDSEPAASPYASCAPEDRVGDVVVEPQASWTTVQGQIADRVNPQSVLDVADSAGDCALWTPPALFCEDGCTGGTVCDVDGSCVPAARNQDVGVVEVLGLAGEVRMSAIVPILLYSFTGDLPFPAFAEDDVLTLRIGGSDVGTAAGVQSLAGLDATIPLVAGEDAVVRWTASSADADTRVRVAVDIANHGGIPARIVCETADDGAVDIDATLVDGLLAQGFSGFPTVTVTRRSGDAVAMLDHCVEFTVRSRRVIPAEIDGLTSCSGDDDCELPETCQSDLTCG